MLSKWTDADWLVVGTIVAFLALTVTYLVFAGWQDQERINQREFPATYETTVGAPTNSFWWEGEAPATYQTMCSKPLSREQADLCQQWRSAESAARMVDLGRQQLFATWISIAALGLTIGLTFRATMAAQRSAKAAEDSLAGSDRPHMIISRIVIGNMAEPNLEGGTPYQYQLTNYGQSPAWIKAYAIWATVSDPGETDPITLTPPPLTTIEWPLQPQGWWGVPELSEKTAFRFLPEHRDGVVSGERRLFLSGIVHYANASGAKYQYQFVYWFLKEDGRMIPYAHPFCKYT